MLNPNEYDHTIYIDTEPDTRRFIGAAIEQFCNQCIGFPDTVYLEAWRRLTTLSHEEWTTFKYGAVTIQVKSPQDNDAHLFLENLYLRPDVAICVRRKAKIPPSNNVPPIPTVGA